MRDLGSLEAAIMDRLWTWGREATVRDVVVDLQRERDLAYTTVMTVMDNLHRKGLVRRLKVGRAFHYVAAETREAHTAALLGDVLGGAGDRTAALLHFIDTLEPQELAELRRVLDTEAELGSSS